MSILDFGLVMFSEINDQITWVQGKGLLSTVSSCPTSGTAMVMQVRSDVSDKQKVQRKTAWLHRQPGTNKSHLCMQQYVT